MKTNANGWLCYCSMGTILLNWLAFDTSAMILQKCCLISAFAPSARFVTFKWDISVATSFTNDVIKKHDPMKKDLGTVTQNPDVYATIDSKSKAIKYPCGVFQSNGNLWRKEKRIENDFSKGKFDAFSVKAIRNWQR